MSPHAASWPRGSGSTSNASSGSSSSAIEMNNAASRRCDGGCSSSSYSCDQQQHTQQQHHAQQQQQQHHTQQQQQRQRLRARFSPLWQAAALLLALLLAPLAATAAPAATAGARGTSTIGGSGQAGYGTEISSSVALFRFVDLNTAEYIAGYNATRCVHMVNRAGRTGSRRINFVISHYFVDAGKDFKVDYFCLKLSAAPECTPATPELIARWTALFQPCLQYAVDLGFDIAFTPHLDDGLNNGQWRNAMLINPIERYGGGGNGAPAMSYFDVVIKPLADAMSATLRETTYVWFALQGEMSAMVTAYPREHLKLLPYVKQLVLGDGRGAWADHVRVGVSTNFNKLCGMDMCTPKDVAKLDVKGVQALYDAIDFVGISAYPRWKGKMTEMEDSTQMFDTELQMFGIDLAQLVNDDGKEFVFNEFGIGGGASVTGDAPARTVQQVEDGPFFGVYGPYTRKLDPWRLFLPYNVVVGTRDRMHDWFNAATMWLAKKGGPTWRVDHVFMWNLNSWDVQGIHMESTTKEGSYRDDVAYRILRSHNLRVRGLTGYDAPGSIAPY